jgi:hypothetical protein
MSSVAWSRGPHTRASPTGPFAVTASSAKAPAATSRSPLWRMWMESPASAPATRYSSS